MKLRFAWKPFLVQSQIVALLVFVQFQTNMWTTQIVRPMSPDQMLLHFALFFGLSLIVALACDRYGRSKGLWKRSAYVLIGALSASITHFVALAPGGYVRAIDEGHLLVILVIPLLLGGATGFLLHKSLGYSTEDDDPLLLEQTVGKAAASQAPIGVATSLGLINSGSAEYYDGPLQVRTSGWAALVAALAGSAVYSIVTTLTLYDGALPMDALPPVFRNNPALGMLLASAVFTLPFFVFVRKSHDFLQARGKDGIKSYALAGLFVPLGFGLMLLALMGPFGVMVILPWIVPSVIAMITYHRVAGFEPLALPSDIEVRDRRTMLPANHVRRRVRRVVPAE
jgi:hypothetical protein